MAKYHRPIGWSAPLRSGCCGTVVGMAILLQGLRGGSVNPVWGFTILAMFFIVFACIGTMFVWLNRSGLIARPPAGKGITPDPPPNPLSRIEVEVEPEPEDYLEDDGLLGDGKDGNGVTQRRRVAENGDGRNDYGDCDDE